MTNPAIPHQTASNGLAVPESVRNAHLPALGLSERNNPIPAELVQPIFRLGWTITLALRCRVVDESSRPKEHFLTIRRREEIQGVALTRCLKRAGLLGYRPPLPLLITLNHSGKSMDFSDLVHAFAGSVAIWRSGSAWAYQTHA